MSLKPASIAWGRPADGSVAPAVNRRQLLHEPTGSGRGATEMQKVAGPAARRCEVTVLAVILPVRNSSTAAAGTKRATTAVDHS